MSVTYIMNDRGRVSFVL